MATNVYCRLCLRKIGPLRRLLDREFCNADHRKRYRASSARALREAGDLPGYEELWSDPDPEDRAPKSSTYLEQAVPALLTAMLAVALLLGWTGGGGGGGGSVEISGGNPSSSFWSRVTSALPRSTRVRVADDFRKGLSSWQTASGGPNWPTTNGLVRPNRLGLWKQSMGLTDYDLEFSGRIERKGMSWAFRATDLDNYYASKIVISRPGKEPNSELIRMIVLDGTEVRREPLPLPLTIQPNRFYNVRVSVQGNRFQTRVDGRLVDSWSDPRLRSGGVGFFNESGEMAALQWVRILEREKGFLERWLTVSLALTPLPLPSPLPGPLPGEE